MNNTECDRRFNTCMFEEEHMDDTKNTIRVEGNSMSHDHLLTNRNLLYSTIAAAIFIRTLQQGLIF